MVTNILSISENDTHLELFSNFIMHCQDKSIIKLSLKFCVSFLLLVHYSLHLRLESHV